MSVHLRPRWQFKTPIRECALLLRVSDRSLLAYPYPYP